MKKYRNLFIFILLSVLAVEISLRVQFGFCDALLYNDSDKYEYIAQPNQDRKRFGAHIYYNSFSQRSDEPDTTKNIILGLGDSVIFGGTWMEQDSLATSIFTKETGVQMLNISAGSWGPDNCVAYLREKGTFGAKAMVLVCSSHDAYDVMSHIPVVGIYPNYPNKQYKSAIIELFGRYIIPRINNYINSARRKLDPDASVVENIKSNNSVKKKSNKFNPGFDELKIIADSLKIPLFVYLHAEVNEIKNNAYNEMGQRIIEWANKNNVLLFEGLHLGETEDMYKDIIHYNEKGQKHMANVLIEKIKL